MGKDNRKKYKLVAQKTCKTDNIMQLQKQMNSDELSETIVDALFRYEDEQKERKKETHINNRLKAFTNMKISKYFDDKSKPKKKSLLFDIYIALRLVFAKEKNIALLISDSQDENSDYGVLPISVNVIISCLFLLIEWFLYILSILCCFKLLIPSFIFSIMNFDNIDYAICSIASFVISKIYIRLLKIECKYNADKHYMLNFLAVIIASMAIIVSILLR